MLLQYVWVPQGRHRWKIWTDLQCVSMPQIYNLGDPRPRYTTPCNGVVSHGAQIGVFGFFPTTHKNKRKQNVSMDDLHAPVRRFTFFYFHAQTTVTIRTQLTNYCYMNFDRGKNPNTPNLSPKAG